MTFCRNRKGLQRFCIRHCRNRNQISFEIGICYYFFDSIHAYKGHIGMFFPREFTEVASGIQYHLGAHYEYHKIKKTP